MLINLEDASNAAGDRDAGGNAAHVVATVVAVIVCVCLRPGLGSKKKKKIA